MTPDQFVEKLSSTKVGKDVFNQYSKTCNKYDKNNACKIRQNNILEYLSAQRRFSPDIMLVGESAGYNGGRRHGLHLIGKDNFVQINKILDIDIVDPLSEKLPDSKTVDIIWNEIQNIKPLPLTFNIFPFHSHQSDDKFSNRAPSKKEIEGSLIFIKELTKMFNPKKVIAIGRVAEWGLNKIDVKCDYVRHPSMGGKNKFVEQIKGVV